MRRVGLALLTMSVAAVSGSCGDEPAASEPSIEPTTQEASTSEASHGEQTVAHPVAVDDVEERLQEWLDAAPASGVAWRLALTPPLPLSWPPADDTRWVRWVYARALDPNLADAERISNPWASVELEAGSDAALVRQVTPQITALPSPQGVTPIDAATAAALNELDLVGETAVGLTGEPSSETAARLRRSYRPWLEFNGVILATLPDAHDAFIAFIRSDS